MMHPAKSLIIKGTCTCTWLFFICSCFLRNLYIKREMEDMREKTKDIYVC